ncbi:putative transmembrane protein [Toxoplasma gondii TgCatPRC2]|uniref:Putative transmembrane protein n=1 Tax=Toxoplasma gondii TgCatPRC2 TaxID=1130821 RepID=A0A151HNA5_TOXGO|nr:putative transmembrane protein [Toxoplasma gondii TgCatPRC2]
MIFFPDFRPFKRAVFSRVMAFCATNKAEPFYGLQACLRQQRVVGRRGNRPLSGARRASLCPLFAAGLLFCGFWVLTEQQAVSITTTSDPPAEGVSYTTTSNPPAESVSYTTTFNPPAENVSYTTTSNPPAENVSYTTTSNPPAESVSTLSDVDNKVQQPQDGAEVQLARVTQVKRRRQDRKAITTYEIASAGVLFLVPVLAVILSLSLSRVLNRKTSTLKSATAEIAEESESQQLTEQDLYTLLFPEENRGSLLTVLQADNEKRRTEATGGRRRKHQMFAVAVLVAVAAAAYAAQQYGPALYDATLKNPGVLGDLLRQVGTPEGRAQTYGNLSKQLVRTRKILERSTVPFSLVGLTTPAEVVIVALTLLNLVVAPLRRLTNAIRMFRVVSAMRQVRERQGPLQSIEFFTAYFDSQEDRRLLQQSITTSMDEQELSTLSPPTPAAANLELSLRRHWAELKIAELKKSRGNLLRRARGAVATAPSREDQMKIMKLMVTSLREMGAEIHDQLGILMDVIKAQRVVQEMLLSGSQRRAKLDKLNKEIPRIQLIIKTEGGIEERLVDSAEKLLHKTRLGSPSLEVDVLFDIMQPTTDARSAEARPKQTTPEETISKEASPEEAGSERSSPEQ